MAAVRDAVVDELPIGGPSDIRRGAVGADLIARGNGQAGDRPWT